ncbi:MAG: molecular chaperone Hsp90 [Lachnospiraceae bacterium]|nr:molecular chaperone Hsp90 [Lachnospiraceae bacterium]
MDKDLLVQKVKDLIAAQSCYPDLKKEAEDYLASIGKPDENEKLAILKESAKACKSPIDACIGFLESDMGKQIYGDKQPETLQFAKDKKAEGEDTCICGACQACKAIIEITK